MSVGYVKVAGVCPMGCGATLFIGDGGHVTCSFHSCPDPSAADERLAVTGRKPYQSTLYLVIAIDTAEYKDAQDAEEKVVEPLEHLRSAPGITFDCLDEHGLSEWVAEIVKRGAFARV